MDDADLLRTYSEKRAEDAFTELVRRHAGLVYSAARRQVLDPELAQEVTQRTFLLMASKAGALSRHPALVGWLYRTVGQVASELRRAERRRRLREQKAACMDAPASEPEHVIWTDLAPCLDEAMSRLSEKDRLAILTRFFEDKPMREVGRALGIGEDAAKVRVGRALERLRGLLARQGITCSAGALAAALAGRSVEAAPATVVNNLATLAAGLAAQPVVAPSILTKFLLVMSTTNSLKIGSAIAGLLLALTATHHLLQEPNERGRPSAIKSFRARIDPGAAPAAEQHVPGDAPSADPLLTAALENLRNALYQPWSSAHPPYDRVAPALAKFGDRKRMAVPLLLAALGDGNVMAEALAARALTLLGAEAAEATPELLRLLKANRPLGGDIVALFTAVHPAPDIIPELLPLLAEPQVVNRSRVATLIGALAQLGPAQAETFRGPLMDLLTNEESDTRFYAALAFARFPGEKPPAAVVEVGKGLKLAQLRDPHAYDPVFDPAQNTTYMRDGEKLFDNVRRFEAVSTLPLMGAEAKQFLADLENVARLTDEPQLRKSALLAIGKIDPERRSHDPEVARHLADAEEGQRFVEKIRSEGATLPDLVAALKYQESAHVAAEELYKRGEGARSALPALEEATRKWAVYDAARVLARFAPEKLVTIAIDASDINAVGIAAQVMAETPTAFAGAAPQLQTALEKLDPNQIGARQGLAEAITAIDPQAPKPIYGWDDLEPAVRALDSAAEAAGAGIQNQVMDLRIRLFQDLNQKTRGEVLGFLAALRQVDEGVQAAFASKLADPSLRALVSRK